MPEPTPSPTPETPAGPQGPAGSAAPGQPPIGSSPATQPVANRGLQAAGLAKIGVAVKLLESILPMLGAGSEAGSAVLKALNSLSKHVQPGSISSGVEQSALSELQNKARQMSPQIAAMRGAAPAGAGAPGGAPPGGAPGGIPPQLAQLMRPQGSA